MNLVDRFRRAKLQLASAFTRKITKQSPNATIVADDWSNVLMGCCDCGLMHRFSFSVDERRRLVISGKRDGLATRSIRIAQRFPFQFDPQNSTADRKVS